MNFQKIFRSTASDDDDTVVANGTGIGYAAFDTLIFEVELFAARNNCYTVNFFDTGDGSGSSSIGRKVMIGQMNSIFVVISFHF